MVHCHWSEFLWRTLFRWSFFPQAGALFTAVFCSCSQQFPAHFDTMPFACTVHHTPTCPEETLDKRNELKAMKAIPTSLKEHSQHFKLKMKRIYFLCSCNFVNLGLLHCDTFSRWQTMPFLQRVPKSIYASTQINVVKFQRWHAGIIRIFHREQLYIWQIKLLPSHMYNRNIVCGVLHNSGNPYPNKLMDYAMLRWCTVCNMQHNYPSSCDLQT